MDKLIVNQSEDYCWFCFNNENNITLTAVNSEKLMKKCGIYLDTSIIAKFFENETSAVSCCSYCYEYTNRLILLAEQINKLNNEISNLGLLFSENVLERRNRLQKENCQRSSKSTPPQDIICVNNNQNAACHSSVKTEIVSLEIENLESVAEELPSQSPGKTEINDCGTDKSFEAEHLSTEEIENVNHSENEIDVKYSYEYAVSSEPCNFSEQNNQMSDTITIGDQETLKTSVPDLLMLKTAVVRLERLQVGKISRSSQKTLDHNIKSEIKDPDIIGISVTESNDDANGTTVLINASIITEENPRKPRCVCHFCGKSFLIPSRLKRHERFHTGEKPFNCSFCTKSFKMSSHLKDHEKIHTGERPFPCSFCSMSFHRSADVRQHEKTHTKETPHKCNFCPKSFARTSAARRHELLIHSTAVSLHKCTFCPKSFKYPYDLNRHEEIHTRTTDELSEETHTCTVCPKSFRNASDAKKHELCHTGERLFQCPICLKSFRSASMLKRHQKTNCKERPHMCSICLRTFKNAADLNKHELFHVVEKPYKCSFCPMSFTVANQAKRHELTHTGERLHKCPICEKTFPRKDSLTFHKRKHEVTMEEFIFP